MPRTKKIKTPVEEVDAVIETTEVEDHCLSCGGRGTQDGMDCPDCEGTGK